MPRNKQNGIRVMEAEDHHREAAALIARLTTDLHAPDWDRLATLALLHALLAQAPGPGAPPTSTPRPTGAPEPLRALTEHLQALHETAGYPPLRLIATRAGVGHTTAHRVLTGRQPSASWPTILRIVAALGGDPDTTHRLWVAARRATRPHHVS